MERGWGRTCQARRNESENKPRNAPITRKGNEEITAEAQEDAEKVLWLLGFRLRGNGESVNRSVGEWGVVPVHIVHRPSHRFGVRYPVRHGGPSGRPRFDELRPMRRRADTDYYRRPVLGPLAAVR